MKLGSTKRFYACRLQAPHTRRHQIGFRISGPAKHFLLQMARARRMSVSEYLARLVNDHLTSFSQGAL